MRIVLELWLIIVNLCNIILSRYEKTLNIRRWWVKPHLQENLREMYGAYRTIFTYFKLHNEEEFRMFVGMRVNQFAELHRLVEPKLLKESQRKPLPSELRLAVVLK